MTVWICGKWLKDIEEGVAWEFQGVFSDEAKAVAACVTRDYFIGPADVDKTIPDEKIEPWPGSYFPLRKPEDPDYNNDREGYDADTG